MPQGRVRDRAPAGTSAAAFCGGRLMQLWRTVRQAALLRLFCVLLLCRSRRSLAFVAAPPRGVCAARTGQRADAACLGGRRYSWTRLSMCVDKAGSPPPASVPLYPLSALAHNRDQQKLAVAREDYSAIPDTDTKFSQPPETETHFSFLGHIARNYQLFVFCATSAKDPL